MIKVSGYNSKDMQKRIGLFFMSLVCIAVILAVGCTSQTAPPAPVPTAATPAPTTVAPVQTATPEATSTLSQEVKNDLKEDGAFLNFLTSDGILSGIDLLQMSANNGICDMTLARNLNKKLIEGPKPGSQNLLKYRSLVMTALGDINGKSNDLSRFKDNIAVADKAYNDYSNDLYVLGVISPPQVKTIDIETEIIKTSTGNAMRILNKMKDEHSFTVSYDIYNGQIKTENRQVSTPTLKSGEIGQVGLFCPGSCTGITVTKVETRNKTSYNMEEVIQGDMKPSI